MNQARLIARQRSTELVTSAIRDRYGSDARCHKARQPYSQVNGQGGAQQLVLELLGAQGAGENAR
jgi:hypothetical protein